MIERSHVECPDCSGEGVYRMRTSHTQSPEGFDLIPCAMCDESGAIICPDCNGDGFTSVAPSCYDLCNRCKGEP